MDIGAAIDYLAPKIPHRPLWAAREVPREPLYVAPCSSRKHFTSSLRNQYSLYLSKNNLANYTNGKIQLPKDSEGNIDYSEEFLKTVVAHYNRPDIPSGYALWETVAPSGHQKNKILQNILEINFEDMGVEVLDEGGRERTAYPEVFLRILFKMRQETYRPEQAFKVDDRNERYQSVIQSSLEAYHAYLTDLCKVPLALAQSISGGKATVLVEVTNSCMEMHSLELQIKNWGKFIEAQNAIHQAGS